MQEMKEKIIQAMKLRHHPPKKERPRHRWEVTKIQNQTMRKMVIKE